MLKKVLSVFALTLATASFGFAEEAEEPKEEVQEEVCLESCEDQVDECQECSN